MLNKLEGLEYKVAYKKWIENKSLIQISHELNFSLDHIKKVSARIGKKNAS
ncbi:hypothetical protein JCM19047_2120 [Bacillus sp. JCM 19047]|nr:hypothetical protein JCM19047_2120 [Bacillus sp. JCM 19047]